MEDVSLYDLTQLGSYSSDPGFQREVAKTFIDTVPQYLNELNHALQLENWELVGRNAHKIKSTVDCMGIHSLKNEIRALEALGKTQRNLCRIPHLVTRVNEILAQCFSQVKSDFYL